MSTSDLFIIFGPLIAYSIGLAIMFGVHSYLCFKRGERK